MSPVRVAFASVSFQGSSMYGSAGFVRFLGILAPLNPKTISRDIRIGETTKFMSSRHRANPKRKECELKFNELTHAL
ncbi:hypothetical protein NBRC116594_35760 [Shimia sp. NS0008-38b]